MKGELNMKRFYYAHYSRYGVYTVWANTGTLTGVYYAFTSKKERDEWVERHEYDSYPNLTATAVTRKEVEQNVGRCFAVIAEKLDMFDGGYAIERYHEKWYGFYKDTLYLSR